MKKTIQTPVALSDEHYYIEKLIVARSKPDVLTKFCNENQQAIFQFLSKFSKLHLLITLIQHSQLGKLHVMNYLLAHADQLDRYECDDLESYVTTGQSFGLIAFYGIVVTLKSTCGILLITHNAEKQLQDIVQKYRYKDKDFNKAFIHNKEFYEYFQTEAIDLKRIESIQKIKICPLHIKNAHWLIRDFNLRFGLNVLLKLTIENARYRRFIFEAIYNYPLLMSRLDDNEGLAESFYTIARKVKIDLITLISDKQVPVAFFIDAASTEEFAMDLLEAIHCGTIDSDLVSAYLPAALKHAGANYISSIWLEGQEIEAVLTNIIVPLVKVLRNEEVVKLYIHYKRLDKSDFAKKITDLLFSKLIKKQGKTETDPDYISRVENNALLIEKYGLPSNVWCCYLKLLGYENGTRKNFNDLVDECPNLYFQVLVRIYQKNHVFFPEENMPDIFVHRMLTQYMQALIAKKTLQLTTITNVTNILRELPDEQMLTVLKNLDVIHLQTL
ncbi:MAG: hypothetical protein M3R00_07170, partial [Pseudomonadota bacterium]|nr:hypothetical protein [Pseudomonadota bacterium]